MKKKLIKVLAITLAAVGGLFSIYYFNLDMKLMRKVVVPFLNKHYDCAKRERTI